MKTYATLLCGTLAVTAAQAEPPVCLNPDNMTHPIDFTTRTYDPDAVPQARHQLDVYWPTDSTGNKVVLVVPGGGWMSGDKGSYTEVGCTLAGVYGLVTVVANYEVSSAFGGKAVHPDHVNDVAAAFAWVKDAANIGPYNGDPNRVYLFGQSAGAHLASLLALDPSYLAAVGQSPSGIRGVISMSGMYELPALVQSPGPLNLTEEEADMYTDMLGNAFGGTTDADLVDPSPQTWLKSNQPPFRVIYSGDDMPGLAAEANRFVLAARLKQTPPWNIDLRYIPWSSYSEATKEKAVDLADDDPLPNDYGHYAEVIAINTEEPASTPTRYVVEFIAAH